MSLPTDRVFTCRLCGQRHHSVALSARETARCVRCAARLATAPRHGPHTPFAFALAGVIFAVPAALLPFITVEKFGNVRVGDFLSSVRRLHEHDMSLLAVWVLACGGLAPLVLLVALLFSHHHAGRVRRAGETLSHWSMPEVYVLGVFIALTRLGSIVEVELNAGFWCYAAMSLALLSAWHAFRLQPPEIRAR